MFLSLAWANRNSMSSRMPVKASGGKAQRFSNKDGQTLEVVCLGGLAALVIDRCDVRQIG